MTARAVGGSILLALLLLVFHLVADGIQNTADENAAIANLNPTSAYNAKLSALLDAPRDEVSTATTTLDQATSLAINPDYLRLSDALLDTQSDIALYGSDLLGKVTKREYDSAVADLPGSVAALRAARLALAADITATPAPTER